MCTGRIQKDLSVLRIYCLLFASVVAALRFELRTKTYQAFREPCSSFGICGPKPRRVAHCQEAWRDLFRAAWRRKPDASSHPGISPQTYTAIRCLCRLRSCDPPLNRRLLFRTELTGIKSRHRISSRSGPGARICQRLCCGCLRINRSVRHQPHRSSYPGTARRDTGSDPWHSTARTRFRSADTEPPDR